MKIEFVTDNPLALNYPPIPAKKMIPDWYKDVPEYCVDKEHLHDAKYHLKNDIYATKTIKGCVPVLDYLTSGYIIRSHSQILITPEMVSPENRTFWWRTSDTQIDSHGHDQCPIKINGVKNIYLKYQNCWSVKVPKGYSCLFYQPKYLLEDRYTLFPAIVDCDDYDSKVAFPGVLNTNDPFYINPGDPIMVVFPFKRDEWESTSRMATEEELKTPSKLGHYLHTKYKQLFHKRKSYR